MEEKLKYIVRVTSTDLEGSKSLIHGLRKIKGVSYSFSNAICSSLNLDKNQKVGLLSKEQVSEIESAIKHPLSRKIPSWMLNRRK